MDQNSMNTGITGSENKKTFHCVGYLSIPVYTINASLWYNNLDSSTRLITKNIQIIVDLSFQSVSCLQPVGNIFWFPHDFYLTQQG